MGIIDLRASLLRLSSSLLELDIAGNNNFFSAALIDYPKPRIGQVEQLTMKKERRVYTCCIKFHLMTLNPIIKFGKEYSHTAAYRPLANFNTHTNTHTHKQIKRRHILDIA